MAKAMQTPSRRMETSSLARTCFGTELHTACLIREDMRSGVGLDLDMKVA